ncbi:hypothetical protein CYLTODRAFT_423264 [Cylindrobasidium torrendii FP15055 ss-10]|uniref:Uncharacterized protein n=1 Tax=Cylindrobasidium torrendii FP15055 ss-10 TaxID=1314674 RepID=A0A0D7B7S4_9AGAR|nr:hypothetical protein CYLTODRAFT_423264 [Cylindrobasidium torrendii FP15055 ss-10]
MATTNIYLSASAAADAWALYFGKGDARNMSRKSISGSKVEGLAELKGLCHLYRVWLEDPSAPEGAVFIHTRSLALITWIRVCMPAAQEHGWKAAAKNLPADIEPVLRYLSALFDNTKISCPKTTVEFWLVPQGIEHKRLGRARSSADRAIDVEEDVDWRGLTLHVRRKLRGLVSMAQFWPSAEELEQAESLLRDAEEYMDNESRKEQVQPLLASSPEESPTAKDSGPSTGSSGNPEIGEQRLRTIEASLPWMNRMSWPKAGAVQVCVPVTSPELKIKPLKKKEWFRLYADLCNISVPDFPNVRAEWKETAGHPTMILSALVSLFGGDSVDMSNVRATARFGSDCIARSLLQQTLGPIADPLSLVVVFRQLREHSISCIGNLPILAAAAARRSPVKFICLPVGSWGCLFKCDPPVSEESCFALTASSYEKDSFVVQAINALPRLTLSNTPKTVEKNTILGKRKRSAKKTAAKKKARSG